MLFPQREKRLDRFSVSASNPLGRTRSWWMVRERMDETNSKAYRNRRAKTESRVNVPRDIKYIVVEYSEYKISNSS